MTPISANGMRGTLVRARSGEELGEIEDVVFDADLRCVDHAIVARRGASTGHESYAVPLASLVLDTENECFVVLAGSEPTRRS
jgi:hypothetical protein